MNLRKLLKKMESEWDHRARVNALHYIATLRESWTDEEFFASGRLAIQHYVANDMENICQGRDPRQMRVVEIGCGVGRLTRALAEVFGEVHGVDVSGEMIQRAKTALNDLPNAFVHQNDGAGLAVLGDRHFDFAFSYLVFQHIPGRDIIRNYFRDVSSLLAPGALFKCQVNGCPGRPPRNDTWLGAPLSAAEAARMADETGFELRYSTGEGTQDFWLWLFKSSRFAEREN